MERTVFERRCSRLQQMLAQQNTAAALVTDPINLYYLTGWRTNPHERFTGLLVPQVNPPALVVPSLDLEAAGTSWVRDVRAWRDGEDPFDSLAEAARPSEIAGGVLAVEKAAISLETFECVAGGLRPASTVDARPMLNSLRVKKDESELDLLQRASDIACEAIESVYRSIRPGMTEREVAGRLDQSVKDLGGDGPAFETTVLSGARSAYPHGRSSGRAIERGELVVIDFGAAFGGYLSDITRTFFTGPWPEDLSKVYDAVLAAHDSAIALVAPGVSMEDIDRGARRIIEERGFGKYFIHRTGHGLGLAIHEEPYLVEGNRRPLEPGMVATIEPGIYLPGIGGVRIEDDLVVTGEGSRMLTKWSTERRSVG